MPLDTLHREWTISPSNAVGLGATAVVTLTAGGFTLTGDDEKFGISFVGGGVGISAGLRNPATAVSVSVMPSTKTPILFPGDERAAQDFDGFGHIIELCWPVFW